MMNGTCVLALSVEINIIKHMWQAY